MYHMSRQGNCHTKGWSNHWDNSQTEYTLVHILGRHKIDQVCSFVKIANVLRGMTSSTFNTQESVQGPDVPIGRDAVSALDR